MECQEVLEGGSIVQRLPSAPPASLQNCACTISGRSQVAILSSAPGVLPTILCENGNGTALQAILPTAETVAVQAWSDDGAVLALGAEQRVVVYHVQNKGPESHQHASPAWQVCLHFDCRALSVEKVSIGDDKLETLVVVGGAAGVFLFKAPSGNAQRSSSTNTWQTLPTAKEWGKMFPHEAVCCVALSFSVPQCSAGCDIDESTALVVAGTLDGRILTCECSPRNAEFEIPELEHREYQLSDIGETDDAAPYQGVLPGIRRVTSLAFDPSGSRLCACTWAGAVHLLGLRCCKQSIDTKMRSLRWQLLRRWTLDAKLDRGAKIMSASSAGAVFSVWSACGKWLALAGRNGLQICPIDMPVSAPQAVGLATRLNRASQPRYVACVEGAIKGLARLGNNIAGVVVVVRLPTEAVNVAESTETISGGTRSDVLSIVTAAISTVACQHDSARHQKDRHSDHSDCCALIYQWPHAIHTNQCISRKQCQERSTLGLGAA